MSDTRSLESTTQLQSVLRLLAAEGAVSAKLRHAAQTALAAIPPGEDITAAYRCSVLTGTSGPDGVALLTPERLSVFERRGFRSPDQKLVLSLTKPFSVEPGPGATRVTVAAAGGRPATLDLFEAERAELFREALLALRSAREEGWWSSGTVAWPGWLGTGPTWSYLGGDPRLHRPALDLRLHIGPAGFTLGDSDGSTAHLAPWSAVSDLVVVGHEQGIERAATGTLLVSEGFAAAWRSAEWTAFLVLGYFTGEQVFLGTTGMTEAELRNRLLRVAAAMPSNEAPPLVADGVLENGTPPAAEAAPAPAAVEPAPAPAAVQPAPAPAIETAPTTAVQPPAPAAETDTPAYSLVEQLERLGALHRQGILDDAEFTRAKAALLGH